MPTSSLTALAVDWSGARTREERRIWLAEVRDGRALRLECGRSRAELVTHLGELARRNSALAVGLGFAFSFPRWFVGHLGCATVGEVWELVGGSGERWLEDPPFPFWGLPGRTRPALRPGLSYFRRTESVHPPLGGVAPKSVFQLGGAGAVGTTSLRGMPWLAELREAGFSIQPFDAPRLPFVVEIYPRYLTGRVNKSSSSARALYLSQHFPELERSHWRSAKSSEDAFDALVSAFCLADAWESVLDAAPADDAEELEGRIWHPSLEAFYPATWPALRRMPPGSLTGDTEPAQSPPLTAGFSGAAAFGRGAPSAPGEDGGKWWRLRGLGIPGKTPRRCTARRRKS